MGKKQGSEKHSVPAEIDFPAVFWSQAIEFTSDLPEERIYSRRELINEVNSRLPDTCNEVTKQKIETRQDNDILHPISKGEAKQRMAWRYPLLDIQINIFIELLQAHFSEDKIPYSALKRMLADIEVASNPDNALSTPYNSARSLLQNRSLGILLTILGDDVGQIPLRECIIGLNVFSKFTNPAESGTLIDSRAVRQILGASSWHIAVGDERSKLYIYKSIDDAMNRRREVLGELNMHFWYRIVLSDAIEQQKYQIVVGLPIKHEYRTENRPLRQTFEKACKDHSIIEINKYPGLSILLKMAFFPPPKTEAGTPLAAMCEILASVTDGWDHVAILLPRSNQSITSGKDGLILQYASAGFFEGDADNDPAVTLNSLIDWRRVYQNGLIIEPVVEHDPRLLFRHQPAATAIVPIVSSDEEIQGLLYVIRKTPPQGNEIVFTEERLASLYAAGRICGDQALRDKVELYTVSSVGRRFMEGFRVPPANTFDNSLELATNILNLLNLDIPIEKSSQYWIYLATLTIVHQIGEEQRDQILSWSFSEQVILFVVDYLSTKLGKLVKKERLPIGKLRLDFEESQYIFPILIPISLSESDFKDKMRALQEELEPIGRYLLDADVFVWGITLNFQWLLDLLKSNPQLGEGSQEKPETVLIKIIEGAVRAGPYINNGHKELRIGNFDQAIIKFEQALRKSPENWYVHKHLGEVRMLQGRYPEAESHCRNAIALNQKYASALCLLADVLIYEGMYAEALAYYEQALRYTTTNRRITYLIRYGIALANMDERVYDKAVQEVRQFDKTILQGSFHRDPAQEAIDKFDKAERLSERIIQIGGQTLKLGANYHYHRGVAYLRSGNSIKAVEEFSIGRRLEPNNTILADALAHALVYQHAMIEQPKKMS